MKRLFIVLSVLCLFMESNAHSEDGASGNYIAVGQAKTRKTVIALPLFTGPSNLKVASEKTLETIRADLLYMDSFQVLDSKAYIDPSTGVEPGTFQMSNWSSIQTEFVMKAVAKPSESGLTLEAYLYNVSTGNAVLTKRYVASLGDIKTLGHTIANDIVKANYGPSWNFSNEDCNGM
jgi:Tol biopolymer transport system component